MVWATEGLDALGDAAAVLAVVRPEGGHDGAGPRLRFVHVNAVGALGMGASPQALAGRLLDEIAPELVGIGDWQHVMEVAVTGAPDTWLSHHRDAWHELRCAPIEPAPGLDVPDDVLRYVLMASRPIVGLELAVEGGENLSRLGGLLLQISRRLGMAVTEDDVAEVVCDVVAPALGGTHGMLAVRHDDGTVRVMSRGAGNALEPLEHELLPITSSAPIVQAVRSGLPGRTAAAPQGGSRTLGVPLRAGATTVGALLVTARTSWDQAQPGREFVDTVATLVAQAVQRAGLYETQLHANLAMQHALLPPGVPEVEGMDAAVRYRPGSGDEVGGDWYDVIPLDNGATAFVIGDVQGHDLAAAALMGQMRSVVRAYLLDRQPPTAVLSGANAFLLSLGADRLVTACITLTLPSARLVTVASAGHPPPVLVPQDGEAELLALDVGPPLGVAAHSLCRERTAVLPPGAQLLLYTDGLVERRSRSYEDGEKLLVAGLTGHAGDSPETLADLALAVAGVDPEALRVEDDAALLAVRWHAPAQSRLSQTRDLPVSRESAVIARWFVGDVLRAWAVGEDCTETAVLLTNELVANAVRHAHRTIRLTVQVADNHVRVEVFDDSHREPRLVRSEELETSGRGLQLVESLSEVWGVTGADGDLGKTVWFELVC